MYLGRFNGFLLTTIALSVGPAIAVYGTRLATTIMGDMYDDMISTVGAELGDIDALRRMANFKDVDHFCDSHKYDKDVQENLCGPYEALEAANISSRIALALTPVLPVMMLYFAITNRRSVSERSRLQRAWLWLIMKMMNKITALHVAPLSMSLGLIGFILTSSEFGGLIVGIFAFWIIFKLESRTIEWYTRGKLKEDLEIERPGA